MADTARWVESVAALCSSSTVVAEMQSDSEIIKQDLTGANASQLRKDWNFLLHILVAGVLLPPRLVIALLPSRVRQGLQTVVAAKFKRKRSLAAILYRLFSDVDGGDDGSNADDDNDADDDGGDI